MTLAASYNYRTNSSLVLRPLSTVVNSVYLMPASALGFK